jgi:NAD+ synthase (glutamine-hydrolysing)
MKLDIGLAQLHPRLGDVEANLQKHLALIDEALAGGVELLVFPELSLTGYSVQDMVNEVALVPSAGHPVFGPLVQASHKLDLVVGFVEEESRERFYISSAYLSGGQIVHIHRKVYLPTYTLFDEGRYFAWGDGVSAFDTKFRRAGILICEDFWHVSPPYLLWLDGADILILTSASPGRGLGPASKLSSTRFVELANQAYASMFGNFVVHTNRVGWEDGINFWGGSSIFDPNGELVAQAPYFEETLLTVNVDLGMLRRTRSRLPLLRDERTALTLRELRRILGEYHEPEIKPSGWS